MHSRKHRHLKSEGSYQYESSSHLSHQKETIQPSHQQPSTNEQYLEIQEVLDLQKKNSSLMQYFTNMKYAYENYKNTM